MNVVSVDQSEDSCLRKFWEVEEPPSHSTHLTETEQSVEQHYRDNTLYVASKSRYQVRLPRKHHGAALGESKGQALQRFFTNERSIIRKGTWGKFQGVVKEYIDLEHASLVSDEEMVATPPPPPPPQETFYMPMHGVVKEASSTTKLRVVFDGSAKSSNGSSLNDILEVGPTLHPTLQDIILRFRTFMSADISKMYREVLLHPSDRQLHRFLWRPHPDGVVKSY